MKALNVNIYWIFKWYGEQSKTSLKEQRFLLFLFLLFLFPVLFSFFLFDFHILVDWLYMLNDFIWVESSHLFRAVVFKTGKIDTFKDFICFVQLSFSDARVKRQVMTPYQEILRFEWHSVTLIPMNQLTSSMLAKGCWDWCLPALELSVSSGQRIHSRWKGRRVPSGRSVTVLPSPSLVLWVMTGCCCIRDSISPGCWSLWDVCGGVWWNPAVLGVKPDWQWTLAASPENDVKTMSCGCQWTKEWVIVICSIVFINYTNSIYTTVQKFGVT